MVIRQFGSLEVYLKVTKDQPAARLDRFGLEQWFSAPTNTYTFAFGGMAHSTFSCSWRQWKDITTQPCRSDSPSL